MLVPGDGTDFVQVIDARDIARFTARAIEHHVSGVFNMAGPRLTWASFVSMLGVEHPVWVSARLIDEAGLTFVEIPLYRPNGSERSSLMNVSHDRASAAGLTLTDPQVTITDVRDWLRTHPVPPALTPERERELIARARASEARVSACRNLTDTDDIRARLEPTGSGRRSRSRTSMNPLRSTPCGLVPRAAIHSCSCTARSIHRSCFSTVTPPHATRCCRSLRSWRGRHTRISTSGRT